MLYRKVWLGIVLLYRLELETNISDFLIFWLECHNEVSIFQ